MMISGSTSRKSLNIGAALTPADSDKLYSNELTPLLESFATLSATVDNASLFVGKGQVNATLEKVYASITALDDRLSSLDASEVTNWRADVASLQAYVNQLTNKFAVYTHDANKSALYSSGVGLLAAGVTGAIVYRRKKSRKWVFFAAASAAAVGGFASWFVARPDFE